MNLLPFVLENRCINIRRVFCIDKNDAESERELFCFLSNHYTILPKVLLNSLIKHYDWASISFVAAKANKQDIIFQLTQAGTINWNTGLNGACKGKHAEHVKYMISKGAKITGHTLSIACEHSDTETFETLLALLDCSRVSKLPGLADFLRFLMKDNKVSIVFRFMKKVPICDEAVFLLACEENSTIVAEAMIQQGALSGDKLLKNIEVGLLKACERGHLEIISLLIEKYGAENIQQAMYWAVEYKQTNVIFLLKKYGAYDGGLIAAHKKRSDQITCYFKQILCRDILQILSRFIQINYGGSAYGAALYKVSLYTFPPH